ncbi:MAG: tetratricopeptide repeat protein [Bacteroidota bacterium]|jgi:tetratricopeptide (TPR) repeat protein
MERIKSMEKRLDTETAGSFRELFGFLPWMLFVVVFSWLFSACNTPESLAEKRADLQKSRTIFIVDTTARDVLDITYKAGNSDVDLRLYFEKEFELFLDNQGSMKNAPQVAFNNTRPIVKPGDPTATPPAKNLEKDMERVLKLYEDAQQMYYAKNYDGSLDAIDASLAILPTAEAYALKGSVLFMLGSIDSAQDNWQKAKELDPEFVMPTIINKER